MTNDSVKNVVAEVLEAVRPEELLILDDADPERSKPASVSGGPMGLGVSMVAAIIAPIVWKVVDSLIGELLEEGAKRTAKLVVDFIAKKFHTSDPTAVKIQITEYASKELAACDISAEERTIIATKIADVVFSKLKVDVA